MRRFDDFIYDWYQHLLSALYGFLVCEALVLLLIVLA